MYLQGLYIYMCLFASIQGAKETRNSHIVPKIFVVTVPKIGTSSSFHIASAPLIYMVIRAVKN